MTRYRLGIRPLTAVHIGCGSFLTPLQYTIRKNKKNEDIFVRFQPDTLVQGLDKQKKAIFSSIVAGNDITSLRKFLSENLRIDSILYTSRVTSGFLKEYETKSGSKMNSLEIEADYRPAGQKYPVIPGSSIKGAFRTAVINERIHMKKSRGRVFPLDERFRRDTELQHWALDCTKPNDDPFRAISIGDCHFTPIGTQLVGRMMHYKPGRNQPGSFDSMAIYAELLSGVLSGCGSSGETDFLYAEHLDSLRAPDFGALKQKAHRNILDAPVSVDELATSCDTYYGKAFDEEFDRFFFKAKEDSIYRSAKNLADLVDSLKSTGEHLVRVGKWSHVESVTLEDPYRHPFGKRGYGKTRTLLEYEGAFLPMGWCAFRITKEA